MGLKELKSNLDLVQGEGSVGGMADLTVPNFQLGKEEASQKHIDSLQAVPGGDSNSPHQDMDGQPGPQFQRERDIASQAHISSLALVPGGDSNSPHQDMDGQPGPQFQRNITAASQAHVDSLQRDVKNDIDLNGDQPPAFQRSVDDATTQSLNSLFAVPGGSSNSPFQDRNDGVTPPKYLDNLPS